MLVHISLSENGLGTSKHCAPDDEISELFFFQVFVGGLFVF